MYFSAEHLALANQAVCETFGQCSIVWQAIPHWATGDPGQISVPNGILATPGLIPVVTKDETVQLTLGQALAPTPDALLTGVMTATKVLAKDVDNDVLPNLYKGATSNLTTAVTAQPLQDTLIKARATVEDAGYRAPSCVVTNTVGLTKLNQLVTGSSTSIYGQLITAANINSIYRSQPLDPPDAKTRLVFIGRRQRIPQGAAPEASPGEEPVDLAVSLLPSLEVDGETNTGKIQLTVRIRYATRITDATGLVAIQN
ncbi:MAG TPA: hypothetical protein VG327_10845 [Mycobacterium sp.]|jgi:hypothetical protein|nr:hypothetical protein [Mycobacterium sp.]